MDLVAEATKLREAAGISGVPTDRDLRRLLREARVKLDPRPFGLGDRALLLRGVLHLGPDLRPEGGARARQRWRARLTMATAESLVACPAQPVVAWPGASGPGEHDLRALIMCGWLHLAGCLETGEWLAPVPELSLLLDLPPTCVQTWREAVLAQWAERYDWGSRGIRLAEVARVPELTPLIVRAVSYWQVPEPALPFLSRSTG